MDAASFIERGLGWRTGGVSHFCRFLFSPVWLVPIFIGLCFSILWTALFLVLISQYIPSLSAPVLAGAPFFACVFLSTSHFWFYTQVRLELTLTWNDELSNCLSLLVLSREFSGMIHFITSNVIIPATPSNSISYVKRTSRSPFIISAPAICHGHGGLFLAELGHPIAGAARCMGCRRGFLLARACPDGRGPGGPQIPRPNGHRSPPVMVTGGRLNQQPGGRLWLGHEGSTPQEYKQTEAVEMKVNKLTSAKTQLPYSYYHLAFCESLVSLQLWVSIETCVKCCCFRMRMVRNSKTTSSDSSVFMWMCVKMN